MPIQSRPLLDPALYPAGTQIEPGPSAVSWAAIFAGSVVAIAASLVLFALGAGLGFAEASPWPGVGAHPASFAIGTGIWLIVTQWLSAALGGYIAGRMRVRWHSLHTDEVFFRDTAHGLLTWATATIAIGAVAVLASALFSLGAPAVTDVTVTVSPETADAMRKASAAVSIFSAIAMLVGAFVACVSAAIGGRLRDRHP